ncbi:MAG: D-alanyl-D-alanine carboxypeptidase/D-alanyl-D-alanine-endopeptidase [Acidimicrobiia bacterium]
MPAHAPRSVPRRRWIRRSALPLALLVAGSGCAAVALRVEGTAPGPRPPSSSPSPATPLLSARRAPAWLADPVAADRLRADLAGWVGQVPAEACVAVRGPGGEALFGHRADVALVPASTEKLVTATAVLAALGPDARFTTRVVADSAGPTVGDLVLVGGGDPLLASSDYLARFTRQPQPATDLDALADRIVQAGVRRVEGSVVGDESLYDRERYVAGWPARYVAQNQVGPLSALTVNDGFEQYPTPGQAAPLVPAADPAANAAAVLTRLLRARGVEILGEPRSGVAPAGATEIAVAASLPLSEIVGQMLRESDNMTAEMLVKAVGLDEQGVGATPAGIAAVAALQPGGLPPGAQPFDGSGLALQNRATCDQLVALLRDPVQGPLLQAGLAVAGESGTLSRRYVDTELAGRLRAKTGSLTSVTALAGVVDDADGQLVFAYLANVPEGQAVPAAAVDAQAQLGEILLGYPRLPDPAALRPLPVAP